MRLDAKTFGKGGASLAPPLLLCLALLLPGCGGGGGQSAPLDWSKTPIQTVEDMFYIQSENGELKMRVEAPRMESYEYDTVSVDIFPSGIKVFGYGLDGAVETYISAREARHDKHGREKWSAYGNVVVRNVVNQQTMETDTLYWDATRHEIWTDCYLRMYSPDGLMQGYGMRSDEMARNAILMHPFDNEYLIAQDSTRVRVDTINLIGPLPPQR